MADRQPRNRQPGSGIFGDTVAVLNETIPKTAQPLDVQLQDSVSSFHCLSWCEQLFLLLAEQYGLTDRV